MGDLMVGVLIGFTAGVLVTGGACLLARRRRTRAHVPTPPLPAPIEDAAGTALLDQLLDKTETADSLRQNLRVKFLYNERKIDDAIAFERERAPQASEEELMRAAIERWERYNR
jgi:hypothetical protein